MSLLIVITLRLQGLHNLSTLSSSKLNLVRCSRTNRAPSGLILRASVQACLSSYTASADHPLLPWCSPSLPFQTIPMCLGMIFALQCHVSGATEPKGELMMAQVI